MAAQNHKGKIALITGANKGIGYELARQLGKEGITVLIAARNAELGNAASAKLKAEGADAHFVELDVTKPETIAKAAQTIRARHGRLDILVNNAGVADKGDGPPSTADPEAVRRVLDVNFFGVLAVTQSMLPLVRNSAAGRIVLISSGLGSLTWNADPKWPFAAFKPLGYNGSKAILNMMTVQLAWELRDPQCAETRRAAQVSPPNERRRPSAQVAFQKPSPRMLIPKHFVGRPILAPAAGL